MQLTEDERAALERYRGCHDFKSYPEYVDDLIVLANLAIRERPVRTYGDIVIRWDDPITPERLVACGFRQGSVSLGCFGLSYYPIEGRWFAGGTLIPVAMRPCNMLDVWGLMERCGIEVHEDAKYRTPVRSTDPNDKLNWGET